MVENDARVALEQLIADNGDDYASMSKLVGRNAAYIQQFIKRGSPRMLPEKERGILARYFGVDEVMLGASKTTQSSTALRLIPYLAAEASAGQGALDAEDYLTGKIAFAPEWLKKLVGNPDALSLISVRGDSMSPTLNDGDDIMVEVREANDPLREGIYVLRMEDSLMVKRLAVGPAGELSILSDNPTWPDWENVKPEELHIIGRVVWVGHKL